MSDNYNGGKDVMPNDIQYTQLSGSGWQAMMGFCKPPSMVQHFPKFYAAYGETQEEARAELIKVMVEDLQKLV